MCRYFNSLVNTFTNYRDVKGAAGKKYTRVRDLTSVSSRFPS